MQLDDRTRGLLSDSYRIASGGLAQDHVFPNHNAWVNPQSDMGDRLRVHGVAPRTMEVSDPDDDEKKSQILAVRLTDAIRFADKDDKVRDLPAASIASGFAGIAVVSGRSARRDVCGPVDSLSESPQRLGCRQSTRGSAAASAARGRTRSARVVVPVLPRIRRRFDPRLGCSSHAQVQHEPRRGQGCSSTTSPPSTTKRIKESASTILTLPFPNARKRTGISAIATT